MTARRLSGLLRSLADLTDTEQERTRCETPYLRMHREIFNRVCADVDQRSVLSLKCDERDLVVVGVALDKPDNAGAGDAPDVILVEVAERDRIRRRGDGGHVLVDRVRVAKDRIGFAI